MTVKDEKRKGPTTWGTERLSRELDVPVHATQRRSFRSFRSFHLRARIRGLLLIRRGLRSVTDRDQAGSARAVVPAAGCARIRNGQVNQ